MVKIPEFVKKIGSEMYAFTRETLAASAGEIVTEETKKRSINKRGDLITAIESLRPEVREALWKIHRHWWKKGDENKFVEELVNIPPEKREEIFEKIARLWVCGKKKEVEQIFYALEHDWWQQLLKKPVKEIKKKVKKMKKKIVPIMDELNQKLQPTLIKLNARAAKKGVKAWLDF
jgi:uncharacterized coiled-coil DUF342 family protein